MIINGFQIKKHLIIFGILLFSLNTSAFAQENPPLIDTDRDGVLDNAEIETYKTDPKKIDTDGDGFSDSFEIVKNSDPLNSKSTPAVITENKEIPLIENGDPMMWYLARISGVTAFILFSLVVTLGLIQSSKSLLKIKIISALLAMEIHRSLAWMGIFSLLLHIGSLFFDDYVRLTFLEAAVPMYLKRNFSSMMGYDLGLSVALGIVSMYLLFILVITSELRNKIVNPKVWRTIHYSSFVGYLLFLAHAVTAGSDSNELWLRSIYAISVTMNVGLLLARIFRKTLFFPKPVVKKVELKNENN